MGKLKYFLVKNKIMVIIALILLVCAIAIAIGVYAQVTNRDVIGNKNSGNNDNHEELIVEFDDIFTNEINTNNASNKEMNYDEIIYTAYNISEDEANYDIEAKIPLFKIENPVTNQINKEIYDTFARTIVNIVQTATSRTTFNLDYVAYVNENILSLVIRCKYKDGSNPQRNIIATYNYDLESQELINIDRALQYKGLEKKEVEKRVHESIKEKNTQMKSVSDQGYNVYMRNEEDDMYKIENTTNFFIGKENYLYIVYAYGNNNYTSEYDLVIF